MIKLKNKEKYDPSVHGRLKSEFLNRLDGVIPSKTSSIEEREEQRRQEIIKDIREGKLLVAKR